MEVLTAKLGLAARACARVGLVAVTIGALDISSGAFAGAANPALEFAVKAAYLSKFPLFVEWPEGAFASPASAVNLCVAGMDPFGDALDKVVEGERIGERPIVIRRIAVVARDSGCHILYIGGSNTQSLSQATHVVTGAGVL